MTEKGYRVPRKTKYQRSLERTEAMRSDVPHDLRPLFDHCIVLAKDSHAHGYYKRSGRELRHARKLVTLR